MDQRSVDIDVKSSRGGVRRCRRGRWSHAAAMAIAATACAAAMSSTASAALLMEFTFEGTVHTRTGDNPGHPWNDVQVGDPASFSYVIDVEQEDQSSGSGIGIYDVESVVVSFGGIDGVPDIIQNLIVDLISGGGLHEVDLAVRDLWQEGDLAAFALSGFGALPSEDIPIDIDLSDFSLREIGYGDGSSLLLVAGIDSYSYRVVPAPASMAALLTAVATRRRRRSR